MTKAEKIEQLTNELLENSIEHIKRNIKKSISSGAIDVDSWDEKVDFMILPKSIIIACLNEESDQYSAKSTCFEKRIKKEVKNISYYL